MKKFRTTMSQLLIGKGILFSLASLAALLAFSILLLTSARGAGNVHAFINAPSAQSSATGEWTAEVNRSKPGELQMTFNRSSEHYGINAIGDSVSFSELQGLTAEIASGAKANVNFTIAREAGTFACEGYFREGRGAGFWTFTSSPGFVAAMRSRGYTNLTEDDLLRAAWHNLTTKFIEDLKSAGYDHLEFQELVRAAGHDVTAAYIREMRSAGYDGLSLEELVRARNHEINSQYIREVRAMGFEKPTLETVIRLRNHEITAAYINDLKAEGYTDIDAETLIRLKNHDIDRGFIQRVKARGISNVTLDQLIKLRTHDIVK